MFNFKRFFKKDNPVPVFYPEIKDKREFCVTIKDPQGWFRPECIKDDDPYTDILVSGIRTNMHDYCPCCGGKTILKEEL